MTIILGLGIFILGAIIGYFVNNTLSSSAKKNNALAEKANQHEAELAQYKLDVAEHLENSAKLLEQMNSTCQDAMAQMEQSTLLLQQATPENIEQIPFFAKETQEQLSQTANLRHNRSDKKSNDVDVNAAELPLDYSGAPSGLFADEK